MVADEVKFAAIESSWSVPGLARHHVKQRSPSQPLPHRSQGRPPGAGLCSAREGGGPPGRRLPASWGGPSTWPPCSGGWVPVRWWPWVVQLADGPGPSHPRVTWVGGAKDHPDVRAWVSTIVGEQGAVVEKLLGALAQVNEVVEAYLPLVRSLASSWWRTPSSTAGRWPPTSIPAPTGRGGLSWAATTTSCPMWRYRRLHRHLQRGQIPAPHPAPARASRDDLRIESLTPRPVQLRQRSR